MAETEGIDRELFDAVEKNDIPKAISLIDQGASLNATQWVGGVNILMQACFNKNKEMAVMLLERGAGVHDITDTGWTPLMAAASEGCEEIAELLLEKGSDMVKRNHMGMNAVHIAAAHDRVAILEKFLARGVDVEVNDNDGCPPLWHAAYDGLIASCRLLMKHGADPNYLSESEGTPLQMARNQRHKEVVDLMREVISSRKKDASATTS